MNKWYQTKIGRSFVILLAVATAVSFLPLMGDAGVFAAEGENGAETYYALPGQEGDATGFVAEEDALTTDELNTELQEQGGAAGIAEGPMGILLQEEAPPEDVAVSQEIKSGAESDAVSEFGLTRIDTGLNVMGEIEGEDPSDEDSVSEEPSGEDLSDEGITDEELRVAIEKNSQMDVVVDNKGSATLSAHVGGIEDIYFSELLVDKESVYEDVYGKTDIESITLDMKEYPVGYHTVVLLLKSDKYGVINEEKWCLYRAKVPTNIFEKPSLRLADFYTGCSYFTYSDNYNSYYYDSDCGVYFDYKRAGKKWSKGWGPVSSGATVKRAKLAAASKYWVHTYFAKKTTYTPPTPLNAETDPPTETKVFKGPVTKNVGFKTAYKKTPVKSIKAKKIKQWCKKYKVRRLSSKIYWRNGYAGWGWYRKILGTKTYKYWYTKVKITCTMKKKPGIAGILLGSKYVKGNKKTYSANFTLAGKKKGKTIKVSVYSYMSKTYGGWSGKTLKKVKVK